MDSTEEIKESCPECKNSLGGIIYGEEKIGTYGPHFDIMIKSKRMRHCLNCGHEWKVYEEK